MKRKKTSYRNEREAPLTARVQETATAPLVESVREGLDFAEFNALCQLLHVSEERLAGLLSMSRATLHRRKKAGRLASAESDRLVRFARLLARAEDVFASRDAARSWLQEPAVAFQGEAPLDFADTETGAREVEDLLGRIEYGVFS